MSEDVYSHEQYLIRRKILTLAGAKFHIYDPAGKLAFFSKLKAFKLKEDIRLYSDESMSEELLLIKARQIIDFSACYDVIDSKTQGKVAAFKRKGLKSILRDEWIIMDAEDNEIGLIQEDSVALAVIRRFLTNLLPQKFHGQVNGKTVCNFKQNFNPFVSKITLDFSADTESVLDRRAGIAGAILLCAIEGKQK